MPVDVTIPELGESIADGVIVRWIKQDGDLARADEALLELETDKATVENPAPAAGRLEIAERAGATVRVGAVVARIAEETAAPSARPRAEPRAAPADIAPRPRAKRAAATSEPALRPRGVALAARAGGAAPEPTEDPPGRGAQEDGARPAASPDGKDQRRVTEFAASRVESPPAEPEAEEVAASAEPGAPAEAEEASASDRPERARAARPGPAAPEPARAAPASGAEPGDVERTPMSRLRRRIAERLVEAKRTAAILTTFNEVDCSRLLDARRRHRERFRDRHGVDLGLMSFFARASVLALADVPIVNAQIEGDDVVQHRRVHLGIAVSTPRGLVVPVVRDADRLSFAGLERAVEELARLARDGRLAPEHLAGGTFTITNGGVFGSLLSTPILNPPQSGILGMHKIEDRPVAADGQVVIRPMMYVALSYDHRLVDGEQAVTFLVRVKERLEDSVRMLLEA